MESVCPRKLRVSGSFLVLLSIYLTSGFKHQLFKPWALKFLSLTQPFLRTTDSHVQLNTSHFCLYVWRDVTHAMFPSAAWIHLVTPAPRHLLVSGVASLLLRPQTLESYLSSLSLIVHIQSFREAFDCLQSTFRIQASSPPAALLLQPEPVLPGPERCAVPLLPAGDAVLRGARGAGRQT